MRQRGSVAHVHREQDDRGARAKMLQVQEALCEIGRSSTREFTLFGSKQGEVIF